MYAVIETGGKQYRVEVGTELEVELLDVEPGRTITLERVLLVADGTKSSIGRPLVTGAEVSAEVVRQTRGEKLIAFKYRPKARSRVKKGHRQELTVLRIADITVDGKSAAKSARKAEEDAKTERMRLEEAAAAQAAKDAELAAKLAVGKEPGPGAPAATTTRKATAKAETGGVTKAPAGKGKAPAAKAKATTAKAKLTTTETTKKPTAKGRTTAAEAATAEPPKRGRAKPGSDAASTAPKPDVATTAPKPATPKRTRATKKDE